MNASSAWARGADLLSESSWGSIEGRTKYPLLEKIRGGTVHNANSAWVLIVAIHLLSGLSEIWFEST
jgi:hypothetical protein